MPPLSTEEFVRRARLKHGNLYDYSKTAYTSSLEKVIVICKEHGEFLQKASCHIMGNGCPTCAKEASKKDQTWTTETFVEKAKSVHGDFYDYTKTVYVFSKTKLTITCEEHGDFLQLPTMHLGGQGCQACGLIQCKKKEKVYTDEDRQKFVADCLDKFGDRYDLTKVLYDGYNSRIIVTCILHNSTFCVVASTFLNSGSGCRKCTDIRDRIKEQKALREKDPTQIFIEKATIIHGGRYTYENVNYINCGTKVSITCPRHGEFWTTPTQHHRGSDCPKCGIEKASATRMYDKEHFKGLAEKQHGSRYEYHLAEYVGYNKPLTIVCRIHGPFQQTPQDHLRGSGCHSCGKNFTYTTETFIARAKQVHRDKYDYSLVVYVSAHKPVQIICRTHGLFEQVAFTHLKGNNCHFCWQASNCSRAQIEWLEYVIVRDGVEIQHAMNGGEFRIPNSRYRADGYCAQTNTVFEYHGAMFHGSPEVYERAELVPLLNLSAGELYDKTMKKEAFIRDQGYQLVTMWETEWLRIRRKVTIIQRAFRLWSKRRRGVVR